MSTPTPKSPAGLSPEARRLWARLHVSFRPDDAGSAQVLEAGLRAFDTMREAEAILRKEGITVCDRYGVPKAHPAVDIARQARSQWIAALHLLGLADPTRSPDGIRRTPKKTGDQPRLSANWRMKRPMARLRAGDDGSFQTIARASPISA